MSGPDIGDQLREAFPEAPRCLVLSGWEPGLSSPYACALAEGHHHTEHVALDDDDRVFAVWLEGGAAREGR